MTEHEQFEKLLSYVAELKEKDTLEEKTYFWEKVIGLSSEQIKEYEMEQNDRAGP